VYLQRRYGSLLSSLDELAAETARRFKRPLSIDAALEQVARRFMAEFFDKLETSNERLVKGVTGR
jgi:hypothetical protein